MSPRDKHFRLTAVLAVTLCLGFLIGAVFGPMPMRVSGQSQAVVDDETILLQRVYQQANPSVVSISARIPTSLANAETLPFQVIPQAPNGADTLTTVAGSGFVYDVQGHIVTNAHVVRDAKRIVITFADDTTLIPTVVGTDLDSDIAVLKIDPAKAELAPLKLVDSDKLTVGERAIAIGNPFGLNGSMSHGIISGVGRALNGQRSATAQTRYLIPSVIQTDASINPGNSGGPLLNGSGEVMGVTTAIESRIGQSSGVSFAVPSNIVKKVADALIKDGKIDHSYLGIQGGTLTLDLKEIAGLDQNLRGVLVSEVLSGSPAAKAGIKPSTIAKTLDEVPINVGGDVITAVDDQPVTRFEDLLGYLFVKTNPGQTIKITVIRDGKPVDLEVTLTKRPSAS